jgi:acetoin utilization protein AcuC
VRVVGSFHRFTMLPRHNAGMVKRAAAGTRSGGPLLVFGPLSPTYDFGPSHPLTPRRFGPGIDLLGTLGAEPGLPPEPAPDDELLLCHTREYIAAVRRFSADPFGPPEAGIGQGGDNPAFPGMHQAGAMVAGGSLRAMDSILRGDVEHAFHPGGGLHHALPDRASGFCIYDDPALAIALARREGLRVLYLDFDVHHGDGVQWIHWADPGVMTVSFHESGRYLFPGTGFAEELGEGVAAGTAINVPLEPFTGERAWLLAVRSIVPMLAASFAPHIVISQHGCDSHAWDPLAHLQVTTTAMGEAARLVDRVAHRWAAGRWLSTGGGGYDAYRVVPRAWSLVWLAGAHREAPTSTSVKWRERWAGEAARFGQTPLPETFEDEPNAGSPVDRRQEMADAASEARAADVLEAVIPAIVRESSRRGWLDPLESVPTQPAADAGASGTPTLIDPLTRDTLARLHLADRAIAPADPVAGHAMLSAALRDPSTVAVGAVDRGSIVALGLAVRDSGGGPARLLALGVAPAYRRRGLARELLRAVVASVAGSIDATVTVAERDPIEPLDRSLRGDIARRLLSDAGFEVRAASGPIGQIDPLAIEAHRA